MIFALDAIVPDAVVSFIERVRHYIKALLAFSKRITHLKSAKELTIDNWGSFRRKRHYCNTPYEAFRNSFQLQLSTLFNAISKFYNIALEVAWILLAVSIAFYQADRLKKLNNNKPRTTLADILPLDRYFYITLSTENFKYFILWLTDHRLSKVHPTDVAYWWKVHVRSARSLQRYRKPFIRW